MNLMEEVMRYVTLVLLVGLCACSGVVTGNTGDAQGVGDNATTPGGNPPGDQDLVPDDTSGDGDLPSAGDATGQTDAPTTALPELPTLQAVQARVVENSVQVTFQPVEGAVDYRIYALPADAAITVEDDGALTIQGATYRCAGNREVGGNEPVDINFDGVIDGGDTPAMLWLEDVGTNALARTRVESQVGGYTRTLSQARLGWVYVEPGAGRLPVYALGDSRPRGDNLYFPARWHETRVKTYTTSTSERTALLAQGYRDDGIVFYVPETASSGTRLVYRGTSGDPATFAQTFYFTDGPELAARSSPQAAFLVLAAEADGAEPLMRVFYETGSSNSHDELVAGSERFLRARYQGDKSPMFSVHYDGLTAPTTLVLEALDAGCPYAGNIQARSLPAATSDNIHYTATVSPADARAQSPSAELYLNGHHEASSRPRPFRRSFIAVTPAPRVALDWSAAFSPDDEPEAFTQVPCGRPSGNSFACTRDQSPTFDVSWINVVTARRNLGAVAGQLWANIGDVAADINGKVRITPWQTGTMSADSYLYATMDVTAVSTLRRYPQLIITDLGPTSPTDTPVAFHMEPDSATFARSLVLQVFEDFPNVLHLQVCDRRVWDVNDQCPAYDFFKRYDSNGAITSIAPHADLNEHAGIDRATRFEMFASTQRAYVFLDGEPYGCADLPSGAAPSGRAFVTFGHVLYHSGVDHTLSYTNAHEQTISTRHYDNLGFKSGASLPAWDHQRFPCVPANQLH